VNVKKKVSYIIILSLVLSTLLAKSNRRNFTPHELKLILGNTAAYCEKLKAAVFHCACNEKIVETIEHSLQYSKKSKWQTNPFLKRRKRTLSPQVHRKRNEYLSQYQLIQKGNQFKEYRLLLRENGKKVLQKDAKLKTIIYSKNALLSPLFLFTKMNQDKYDYTILKKEKIMKRDAYVVEIELKKRKEEKAAFAVAWVDAKDFSVLKFEAFPESLKGYDYLVRTSDSNVEDIKISDVHYFGYQKDDIRFPTKTEITLSYTGNPESKPDKQNLNSLGLQKLTKISTTFTYKKYLFYKVTVNDPIFETLDESVDMRN
jgi:hypothetical protein